MLYLGRIWVSLHHTNCGVLAHHFAILGLFSTCVLIDGMQRKAGDGLAFLWISELFGFNWCDVVMPLIVLHLWKYLVTCQLWVDDDLYLFNTHSNASNETADESKTRSKLVKTQLHFIMIARLDQCTSQKVIWLFYILWVAWCRHGFSNKLFL